MLSEKLTSALNDQLNKEMFSYYLYLSMAAFFESKNLKGFSHWMFLQAREEEQHAMKIFKYIIDRGGKVVLQDMKAPVTSWDSPLNAMEAALQHEKFVTKSINDLLEISRNEKDNATEVFLHWFITEQVEEESTAESIVERMKMMNFPQGVFKIDTELGNRK